MQNPFLIGEQVYFRALEEADAPCPVQWLNDPEVNRTLMVGNFPLNLLREQDFIRKLYTDQKSLILAIVLKDGDRYIGNTGLHDIHPVHRVATFGIAIGAKDCWGKGYGTEATRLMVRHGFETLNLNRISLNVYDYNERGIRAYEKAGFKKEGVLRKALYAEGAYHDVIVMGILREEWNEKS